MPAKHAGTALQPTFYGFAAALEIDPVLRSSQFYVIINTVTSLLGSCLSTFAVSALISNKCAAFLLLTVQTPCRMSCSSSYRCSP